MTTKDEARQPSATGRLANKSHRYWHAAFFAGLLVLLLAMLRALGPILTPVVAALVLSYLFDPLVCWFHRRLGWSRWAGTLLIGFLVLLAVGAVLVTVVPVMISEIQHFVEAVPGYLRRIPEQMVPWAEETFHIRMPHSMGELVAQLGADVRQVAANLLGPLGGVAGKLARRTAWLLSTLGTFALVPVFALYFLPKFPEILAGARSLIPPRFRSVVGDTASEIDRAIAAWIRGQLTVMVCLSAIYAVGLSIVGIKMAVVIGVLTGMLAFIPYVGVSVGVVLGTLICLLEHQGWGHLLGVYGVFLGTQILDGLILTPRIVGEKVGLGPVGVLLALMLGGNLFGFVGVLLAVPVAAALVVIIRRLIRAYQGSHFFSQMELPVGVGDDASD